MSFPICKFFREEQGCKFGSKCRFRHSDSLPPPLNQSFDRQHQNEASVKEPSTVGRSLKHISQSPEERRNGSSVNHPHSSVKNTLSIPPRFNKQANSHGSTPVKARPKSGFPKVQQGSESTDNENGLTTAVQSSINPKTGRKICQYYARNGRCCFGSKCRFDHVGPSRAPRFTQKNEAKTERKAEPTIQSSEAYDIRSLEREVVNISEQTNESHFYKSVIPEESNQGEPEALKSSREKENYTRNDRKVGENVRPARKQPKAENICRFFAKGKCYKGSRCHFSHSLPSETATKKPEDGKENLSERQSDPLAPVKESSGESSGAQNIPRKVEAPKHRPAHVNPGMKKYPRGEVDDVEASKLRRTEIDALMKRFPKSKVSVKRDCAEFFECVVSFSPTDPDWPYDVKVFELQFDIPADYPFEMMTISLPSEQDLPETVRRYVEVSIEEWLGEKERMLEETAMLELVFRPFLRWLDRNIVTVVTEGLKQLKREMVARASGLEFISAKQLQKQYPGQTSKDNGEQDINEDQESEDDETTSDSDDESSDEYGSSEEQEEGDEEDEGKSDKKSEKKSQQDKFRQMLAEPERRGTELLMKNLQLKESAATLCFEKLCLAIQCERCKGRSEFMASWGRVNMVQCGQCGQTQVATFRPAMMHQFSSVAGFLDLDGCLPFDVILQNSNIIVSCLQCSKETKPGAMLPGTPQDHWCRVCHQKLRVAADGVRFTQLEPSKAVQSIKGMVKVVVPTRKRLPKDPAIVEGKPLPGFGTCKHYKKSYRWLRFPCCGKTYPCDICHDSKEDHEYSFANRMICGFCCKEQPFAADKPCKGCDMHMTRVHTSHWEGGQGCRDKISMSRNDKHKHSNMSKTISKHSQKVKDMQSKKKTKLRHT